MTDPGVGALDKKVSLEQSAVTVRKYSENEGDMSKGCRSPRVGALIGPFGASK